MALRADEADQRVGREFSERPAPGTGAPDVRAPGPGGAGAPHSSAAAVQLPVEPPPRSRRKLLLGVALVAGLGFAAYKGYEWWTVGRFVETTNDAYVQADITVLAAKVSGYLASMDVINNQSVAAGQLIARIDDGDYRIALDAAKARLDTQTSTIARIERQIEAGQASVSQAQATLESARAELIRSQADYERQVQLTRSQFASRAHLDDTLAARDRAEAAVRSAEAGVIAARANVEVLAAQRVEAQRQAVELQTQVRKAERDLSFTEIRAPFAGVIGNKAVENGAYVDPGKRVAALVPLDSVRVDANFKETQVGGMKPGQPVLVKVDAFPEHDFTGRVVSLAPASGAVFSLLPPDNATGNFTKVVQRVPVRIAIPPEVAAKGFLRPGMSIEASVDTRPTAN